MTVQSPVKKQQPDGMSHRGGGGGLPPPPSLRRRLALPTILSDSSSPPTRHIRALMLHPSLTQATSSVCYGCLGEYCVGYLSGTPEMRQLGGFSGVGAIVPSFLPAECSGGMGMWGIFGKPLKRAIWNTLGLHAVLTVCLIFLSFLGGACVACCLFLSTGSHEVCIQIHAMCCCVLRCTTKAIGSEKSALWRCKLGAGYGHMSPSIAKRPLAAGSKQPACTHKEHQILTTTEAVCGPCLSTQGGCQSRHAGCRIGKN